jgi:hypothetical protein
LHEKAPKLPFTYVAYLVYDSHTHHENIFCQTKENILYYSTWYILPFIGNVSYKISKDYILSQIAFITDVPRYRAFSPIFIYSVCVYVVTSIMSILIAWNNILDVFKKDGSINNTVYNSVLIIMLVTCTCLPVLSWIDTPKLVQYLHQWETFQVGSKSEFLQFITNRKFYVLLFYLSNMRFEIHKNK